MDESKPALSVRADIIRLMQVNKAQMLRLAQEEFIGATPLMEWLIGYGHLPMRKAKMVVERAVKYSEKEGKEKVSHQSFMKALGEMKINLSVNEQDVDEVQRPERILTKPLSVGAPSKKRIEEGIASLRKKVQANRNWLIRKRRGLEKAKALLFKMEKDLLT